MAAQAPVWQEWYRTKELAKRWKVHRATITRYRKNGEIVGAFMFGAWHYSPESVAAWERAHLPEGVDPLADSEP